MLVKFILSFFFLICVFACTLTLENCKDLSSKELKQNSILFLLFLVAGALFLSGLFVL